MSTDLVVKKDELASWDDFLPVEASKKALARCKAVVGFVAESFEFGTHYDVLPNEQWKCKGKSDQAVMHDTSIKKFMKKTGADMLCLAWGLHSEDTIERSIDDVSGAEPYFFYVIRVDLIHTASGQKVGSATGMASSREVKYRYRWVSEQDTKDDPGLADIDLTQCKKKAFGFGTNRTVKYRVPNPDIGDVAPTVYQIARKRAYVQAVRSRFGVGDLFEQPLDAIEASTTEQIEEQEKDKPEKGKLSQDNLKAPPNGQQSVFPDEPPHPAEAASGSKGKPPAKKPDTVLARWEDFCKAHRLSDFARQYVCEEIFTKNFDVAEPKLIKEPVEKFQEFLDGVVLPELREEKLLI